MFGQPDYYKSNTDRDVIDIVKELNLNFNLGNVLKYITRAGFKDSDTAASDLKKAIEYLSRELKHVESYEDKIEETEGKLDVICLPEHMPLKGLNPMQILEIMLNAVEVQEENNLLRDGQALCIATNSLYSEHYKEVISHNPEVDPFHNDGNIDDFFAYLMRSDG